METVTEHEFRDAMAEAISFNCPFEGMTVDPDIALEEFRANPDRRTTMAAYDGQVCEDETPADQAALFFILNDGPWWVAIPTS